MFEVAEWSGESAPFEPKRFQRWLKTNMGLRNAHARYVASEVRAEFKNEAVVQPQELILASSRIAVTSLYIHLLTPRDTLAAALPISPGDAISAASGAVQFIAGLISSGWKEEPGGGWIKEEGSAFLFFDDASAPRFVEIEPIGEPECCEGRPGIELKIKVTVSDDGGGGNDSGVKKVELFTVSNRGVRGALWGTSVWTLSEDEGEETEGGNVSHVFTVCVPCAFIVDKIADIWFDMEDDDGNCRIRRLAFSVEEKYTECCGDG